MESNIRKTAEQLLRFAAKSYRLNTGVLRAVRKVEVFPNMNMTRTSGGAASGEQITAAAFYARDKGWNGGYVFVTPDKAYFNMDANGNVFKPGNVYQDIFQKEADKHPPGNAFILNDLSIDDHGRVFVQDVLERTYTLYYAARLTEIDA